MGTVYQFLSKIAAEQGPKIFVLKNEIDSFLYRNTNTHINDFLPEYLGKYGFEPDAQERYHYHNNPLHIIARVDLDMMAQLNTLENVMIPREICPNVIDFLHQGDISRAASQIIESLTAIDPVCIARR